MLGKSEVDVSNGTGGLWDLPRWLTPPPAVLPVPHLPFDAPGEWNGLEDPDMGLSRNMLVDLGVVGEEKIFPVEAVIQGYDGELEEGVPLAAPSGILLHVGEATLLSSGGAVPGGSAAIVLSRSGSESMTVLSSAPVESCCRETARVRFSTWSILMVFRSSMTSLS